MKKAFTTVGKTFCLRNFKQLCARAQTRKFAWQQCCRIVLLEAHFLQSPLKKSVTCQRDGKEQVKQSGEGQNFLGGYSLIEIRAAGWRGEESMNFQQGGRNRCLEKSEFTEETEQFVPTTTHFPPDLVMKSTNLLLPVLPFKWPSSV